MVYIWKNVRQNINFDEMPVDNIIYSRSGGCFISFIKGIILTLGVIFLGCLLGICIFYTTRQAYRVPHDKTLQEYVTYTPTFKETPKSLKNLLPSNYRLILHPIFYDEHHPYSYNGTVYITFTPTQINVMTIELDAQNLLVDTNRILLNRKMPNVSNGTQSHTVKRSKRYVDSTEDGLDMTSSSSSDPNGITTTKSDYEFLELTTGFDEVGQESEENTNNTSETLTSTTSKAVLEHLSIHDDVKKDLYTEILIKRVLIDKHRHKVIINLGLRLLPGLEYILRVNFSANMTTSGYGLLYSKYEDDGYGSVFATTVTGSHGTSTLFPCFDVDPTMEITFDTSIIRDATMNTVSTGELKNSEVHSSKLIIDHYKTTLPIQLKSYGFAITQMPPTIITINDELSVYAYFRKDILPMLNVDDYMPIILNALENATGTLHPSNKIRIVGVPNTFDSISEVKNSLIIASEKYFINRGESENIEQLTYLTSFVASMWFDAIADNHQTEENWINEAFPTYLLSKVLTHVLNSTLPSEEIYFQQRVNALNADIILDKLLMLKDNSSRFIANKIASSITYKNRGVFLLKSFETILGRDNFTDAIHMHCELRIQGIPSSLLEHFQKILFDHSIDINLGELSRPWQNTHDHPIIYAQKDEHSGNLMVSQNVSNVEYSRSRKVLPVPIEILTGKNPVPLRILWSRSTEIPLKGNSTNNMFIINFSGNGYYRSNYDIENWKLIIELLEKNYTEMNSITRSVIIDDAFNLAQNGHLNYSILIDLVDCWRSQETEYLPWKILLDNLNTIYQYAADLPVFKDMKFFITKVISPIYKNSIQSPQNGTSFRLKLLINDWACKLDMIDCVESMKQAFKNLIKNGTIDKSSASERELRTILCNAVKYGDAVEYEILERGLITDDIDHKRLLISSMGCTREHNNLEKISGLLSNATWKLYTSDIVTSISENKIGKILFLEILYNQFDAIVKNIGLDSLLPLFESISTEFELRLLENIYAKHNRFFGNEHRGALKYIVQKVHSILRWKETVVKSDIPFIGLN